MDDVYLGPSVLFRLHWAQVRKGSSRDF